MSLCRPPFNPLGNWRGEVRSMGSECSPIQCHCPAPTLGSELGCSPAVQGYHGAVLTSRELAVPLRPSWCPRLQRLLSNLLCKGRVLCGPCRDCCLHSPSPCPSEVPGSAARHPQSWHAPCGTALLARRSLPTAVAAGPLRSPLADWGYGSSSSLSSRIAPATPDPLVPWVPFIPSKK